MKKKKKESKRKALLGVINEIKKQENLRRHCSWLQKNMGSSTNIPTTLAPVSVMRQQLSPSPPGGEDRWGLCTMQWVP
jgi:hypothetical protein